MGAILSTARTIEQDHKDIQDLFAAAKMGQWQEVWRIIGTPDKPRKLYMINLIPENRRWGILQQAVYWNNLPVIKELLKFPTCDKNLRAKDGNSEKGYTGGNTAKEIADLYGHKDAARILENHVPLDFDSEIDTFYTGSGVINNEEFGLFRLTLAAYKEAFHPAKIDKTKSLAMLANDVFRHINTGSNWLAVKDRVEQSLFSVCKEGARCLAGCANRKDFFKLIIKIYTDEDTQLYTYLNTALRRQRDSGYRPTSGDLSLGPYIVMFHLLLFCWRDLKHENKTTYRKMKISAKDLQKYQPGKKFTWLSFVSSSVQQECAQIFPSCEPSGDLEVHFVIDNSTPSQWQPLNIEDFACYTEQERVYPAGAQYIVTRRSVVKGTPTIKLQLLSGDTRTGPAGEE